MDLKENTGGQTEKEIDRKQKNVSRILYLHDVPSDFSGNTASFTSSPVTMPSAPQSSLAKVGQPC